ncbi:MAG TPA: methionyl-tRNA formyltransferase [Actinomycetota bacterium]|nr:methionyl-tRNA formyltransferase [Actinomycetota bacterium]
MRTVFFGTPAWAVPSLEALIASDIEVVAVVTNPDKPAGRRLEPRPSPVKQAAVAADLPVVQVESAKDPQLADLLGEGRVDVATVVAYGKLLPSALLAVPPRGFVNVHFSLLPAYRGAAPVQRAVMDGATETGVSIMVLTAGMDEGPVLATVREPIAEDDTAASLGERLAGAGARLLVETLPRYVNGSLEPVEQDHSAATYAPRITNEETRVDWSRSADEIRHLIRGLTPDPGAWTTVNGRRFKIFAAVPVDASLAPASVRVASGGELLAGTGTGALELVEVQPAGKKTMTGADFVRGLRLTGNERLGE